MHIRTAGALGAVIIAVMSMTQNMAGQGVKTAVLAKGHGAEGIKALLQSEKYDVAVIPPEDATGENLLEYDVLILGSASGGFSEKFTEAVRDYVEKGGGILINHAACGSADRPGSALFPEVFRGAAKSTAQRDLAIAGAGKHPIAAGVPAGFSYAYTDHICLIPGPAGTVIAGDPAGNPVVVAGSYGQGRVVGNGTAAGLWPGNQEKAPAGGERQLVLNAVKWLTASPLSALSPAERGARQAAASQARELRRQQAVDELEQKMTGWFNEELIRSRCIQREPLSSLGGKFFMIARIDISNQGYERTRQNLRMLKNMGVTDIIHLTIRGNQVYHLTAAPGAFLKFGPTSDPLLILAKAAGRENIGIWLKLQLGEILPAGENNQLCARDAAGKPYLYGSQRFGDFLSEDYRKMLHTLIDEYAGKYNEFGSIKGLYIDMPFIAYPDFHGDDLELFQTYCRETFGESLPGDIGDKLKMQAKWCDPRDPAWRRFVLFKQWVCEKFVREMAAYVRGKGLEFALQIDPPAYSGAGWLWAHNPARLAGYAGWIFRAYP